MHKVHWNDLGADFPACGVYSNQSRIEHSSTNLDDVTCLKCLRWAIKVYSDLDATEPVYATAS